MNFDDMAPSALTRYPVGLWERIEGAGDNNGNDVELSVNGKPEWSFLKPPMSLCFAECLLSERIPKIHFPHWLKIFVEFENFLPLVSGNGKHSDCSHGFSKKGIANNSIFAPKRKVMV